MYVAYVVWYVGYIMYVVHVWCVYGVYGLCLIYGYGVCGMCVLYYVWCVYIICVWCSCVLSLKKDILTVSILPLPSFLLFLSSRLLVSTYFALFLLLVCVCMLYTCVAMCRYVAWHTRRPEVDVKCRLLLNSFMF